MYTLTHYLSLKKFPYLCSFDPLPAIRKWNATITRRPVFSDRESQAQHKAGRVEYQTAVASMVTTGQQERQELQQSGHQAGHDVEVADQVEDAVVAAEEEEPAAVQAVCASPEPDSGCETDSDYASETEAEVFSAMVAEGL